MGLAREGREDVAQGGRGLDGFCDWVHGADAVGWDLFVPELGAFFRRAGREGGGAAAERAEVVLVLVMVMLRMVWLLGPPDVRAEEGPRTRGGCASCETVD